MSAGEYADPSALDNRMWAAAELLRTTGERRYLEYFEEQFPALKLDPTGEVSYSEQGMAAVWAYVQSTHRDRDPAIVAAGRKAIIAGADWRIRQIESHPWFAPAHPRRSLTGWGNFAHSTRAALTLLQAYALTGDQRYLEWARRIADAYIEEVLPGHHGVPADKWDFAKHQGDNQLRLREHGKEAIVGLTLVYALEQYQRPKPRRCWSRV